MSRELLKSTFREITGSFGRYIAILLICGLGVGFFSGLKLTKNAMVHSADVYYEELSFYDFKLLSTMGFDEESAEGLLQDEMVAAAEGARSADIIVSTDNRETLTVKTMSLPKEVNTLFMVAGRLPKESNECVGDSRIFGSEDIGQTVSISPENEEDDRELFRVKEYKLVGVAYSPLYGNHERGNTTLGNGTIDGFLCIPYDAYDMDYDTEIYVRLKGGHGEIYSDAYKEMVETNQDAMENLCAQIADSRYQDILAEAGEKLADAKKELAEGKEEGEQELADALTQLEDGEKEVSDGEDKIRKAKDAISKGENTIAEKEKEYKAGKTAYQSNLKEYKQGKAAYDAAKAAYDSEYATYRQGLTEYENNKNAYDNSEMQYAAKKEQYEAVKGSLLEEQRKQTETELAAWRNTLDATRLALAAAKQQLDTAEAQLAEGKKTLAATEQQLKTAKQQLEKAEQQLKKAPEQIAAAKKELEKGKKEIASNEAKLADARQELLEGERDYEEGRQEFDEEIAKAEKKISDAEKELADVETPDTYVLGRDTNVAYVSYESDSQIVAGLAHVFPIFFFLVAALVCITTMTRMMEEQRTQIGVLKALGYSGGAIVAKYLIYSGSAALIGGVIGYFGGAWLFPYVIWTTYTMMYHLGEFHYVIDGGLAILSIAVAFLCSAGTTFFACNQELAEMAASLMRPKAPKVGKRVLLERISLIWNRLKFLDKVSVRNLFRYKKRFFMMIIGIGGCTALLVTGFGLKDSIANVANIQYDEIFIYDMAVSITDGSVEVEGMKSSMCCYEKAVEVTSDILTKSVNLVVPENQQDFSSYIITKSMEGISLDFPKEGEVMLSQDIASRLGVTVGDTIKIADSEQKGGELTVCGVFENYIGYYALITTDTYTDLFKAEPDYNMMYVNTAETADVHGVSAALLKEDGVSMVSVSLDTKERVTNMMKTMNLVVLLVIACAGLLAFVVIFNLNNINITERLREIATIKVLGFYRKETKSYVFRENVVLTLFGGVFGLFLGYCLHAFVMSSIHVDGVAFPQRIAVLSYILSMVLTLVFNQIVSWFMSGKLEQINMAEALKSVD